MNPVERRRLVQERTGARERVRAGERGGAGDAGVEARLQPSRVAHRVSARRRSSSRIGMPPNVQRAEQHPSRRGDVSHRGVERGLIGLRWGVEAADFAHELQRRVMQLHVGRCVIRVSQSLDVSTHNVGPFVIYRRSKIPRAR